MIVQAQPRENVDGLRELRLFGSFSSSLRFSFGLSFSCSSVGFSLGFSFSYSFGFSSSLGFSFGLSFSCSLCLAFWSLR